ncbi:MAG TPA: hypothetical protein VK983_04855 [Candidatus Limnocylindrales bacterium]|nr:hypothetical protein [Candidatus Limnocylindrales bacterium]
MLKIRNEYLQKGVFALAVVAIAGVVGGVNFAQAAHGDKPTKEQCEAAGFRNFGQCVRVFAQDRDGYGNGAIAEAAADAFEEQVGEDTDAFTGRIDTLVDEAQDDLTPSGRAAAASFDTRFEAETGDYEADLDDAFDDFRAAVDDAAETSTSRNEFIDRFNRAKAEYFNRLDAAKNELAAELSGMGHDSNVAKDRFMNGFNAARDAYGNRLEEAKNVFADTVR